MQHGIEHTPHIHFILGIHDIQGIQLGVLRLPRGGIWLFSGSREPGTAYFVHFLHKEGCLTLGGYLTLGVTHLTLHQPYLQGGDAWAGDGLSEVSEASEAPSLVSPTLHSLTSSSPTPHTAPVVSPSLRQLSHTAPCWRPGWKRQ